ncbi:uncharacterized protein EV420DRAFT_295569 [Desarmillaria tabescens]|uniref:Uncharacterized protein n=1 Tax=Armillaria tabescens TaxID=1929756 RepID=A0AA39MJ69_ARMTA|nr:uncharacterized protein EV420DRAFT_295569 [Desarmillaria tabescens]KAK0435813.1 hypothetical protein EV420DRAFT_295569 [Desarmillaria tabescens]
MPGFSLPWSRDVNDDDESSPWERGVPTPRSTVGFFYPPPSSSIPPVPTDLPNNTNTISSSNNVHADAHAPSLPRNSTLRVHEKAAQTCILLLFFLPLPPLFSTIYAALGGAILGGHVPVRSFAEAGATGGTILALPLALAIWILLAPEKQSPREDFFDDDEPQTWWTRWGKFVLCGFILVFVGVATSSGRRFASRKRITETWKQAKQHWPRWSVGSFSVVLWGLSLLWGFCRIGNTRGEENERSDSAILYCCNLFVHI